MVETVGTQLKRARVARELSLEDAARETKIRVARLSDLESDVYTNFPNLAYARGFLTSYGKYLAVDVRPYLDAFENTSTFGVDDYQYLSETPVGVYRAPRRVWRQRAPRKRLMALGGTLGLLVASMFGWFLYINYLRLGDLNKLADHQESRTRQTADLTPTAMLAKPIPSETPAQPAAPAPSVAPATPAAKAPEPVNSTQPTEIVMMEKLATAQPVSVPEASTLAPAALVAAVAPIVKAPAPLPQAEPAREHQLIENRSVGSRATQGMAGHRLSAHSSEQRSGRASLDTAPPQPPAAVKSFE